MRLARLVPLALACGASALPVLTLPWFGHVPLDNLVKYLPGYRNDLAEERTIYEVLKDDKQYSRLVKAIELSESLVDFLSDSSKSVTFFAVPNSKLPRHDKHHHEHNRSLVSSFAEDLGDATHYLGNLVQKAEELEEESDSHDKEKRKEALARIIHKIVGYHILPGSYETADFAQNSTYATNLTLGDGSMDWEPLRLTILSTSVPPRILINLFVEVTKRDIKARNGVIHQISHPLLPPPSIFQETFSFPEIFSFFTTAIQRVGLTPTIDRWRRPKDDRKENVFLGATATTAFAPKSEAFRRLPLKLKMYLFSSFGQKALKKLLEYHIVPDFVLHSDYFHNSSSDATEPSHFFDDELEMRFSVPMPILFDGDTENTALSSTIVPLLELVYEYNATLPTLLRNHYLRVHISRYQLRLPVPGFPRYYTSFKVNGHRISLVDIPARNGALHVLPTILDPRKGYDHHSHDGVSGDNAAWEDWEEWLPQWAMES